MKIYGLPNCDTTKASIKWLKEHKIAFEFHDLKKEGISKARLENWIKILPVEKLLNKQSTTWRGLTPGDQASVNSIKGALSLIEQHTSLIKRPLIEWKDGSITCGYKPELFQTLLKAS